MISLYSKFQVNLMIVVNLISIGNKDTTIYPDKVGPSEVQLILDVNIKKTPYLIYLNIADAPKLLGTKMKTRK